MVLLCCTVEFASLQMASLSDAATSAAAARFRSASDVLKKNMEALKFDGFDPTLLGETALLILELKSSSRATHLAVERCRQIVQDCKKGLDAHHLQLQNLMYRKQHLLRELTLCHDFTIKEVWIKAQCCVFLRIVELKRVRTGGAH